MASSTGHPRKGVRYLTSAQAAEYLGVSPRTVGKYIERGALVPQYRTLGGHARFTREYLDKVRQGSPAATPEEIEAKRTRLARELRALPPPPPPPRRGTIID